MRPGEPSRARPAARSWITAELLRPQVMSVMPGAALTLPVTWTGRRREAGALPRLGCRRPLDRVGDPPDHEGYRRLHRTSRGRARLECPMPETLCTAGDVELCYETFGDHSDPALLLVMGLSMQMLGWHEDLCEELAGRGFFVIRYDNRDVGRSTSIRGPVPTTWQLVRRDKRAAAYQLADMAADAIGLLDHLGIERAHVVGASMGGMIAQAMAARYTDRVISLVSIMSNTGARTSGQPKLGIVSYFLGKVPSDREAYVERIANFFAAIGSPG